MTTHKVNIDVVEPYVRNETMTVSSKMDRKARTTFQFSQESHSDKLLDTAIILSFGVNIFLLLLKLWIIIGSFSMIMLYCVMDSILDVVAGGFVLLTRKSMKASSSDGDYSKLEENESYPAGTALLEPVCNIVYSTAMCSASLQLAFYSVKHLIEEGSRSPQFTMEAFLVIGFTIVIKFVLYAVCKMLATRRGQHVDILADDHISDVFNHIVALAMLFATTKSIDLYWMDDVGCLILASTTAFSWMLSDRKVFGVLSGGAATQDFYSYIVTVLEENIPEDPVTGVKDFNVSKVSAFHFGIKYMVEVEITPVAGLLRMQDGLRSVQDLSMKLENSIKNNQSVGHMVERCVVTLSVENVSPQFKVEDVVEDAPSRPKGCCGGH